MKRLIALVHLPRVTPCLLSLNVLGAMNRNQTGDKTLSDGTPPTPGAIDQFWKNWGIDPDKSDAGVLFSKVTYGPAAGFPHVIGAVKNILGLNDEYPVLLNDGGCIAQSIRERAFQSQTNSAIPILTFDTIVSFQTATQSEILSHLKLGGNVQVRLDALLPQFPGSEHDDFSLSAEIVGNPKIYEQMIFQQGYIGPILEPVAQALLPQFLDKPIREIVVDTPSCVSLEQDFSAYFGEQTGHVFEPGVLVSGGCSGALYDILRHSPNAEAIIQAPFFAPQEGIALSANRRLTIAPSPESFLETLRETSNLDVLITFPNNPDGKIPTLDKITQIIGLANDNGHRLIFDMTYFNVVTEPQLANYQAVVGAIKDMASQYLMIASGSKALGLTKYRVALVLGDPASLALVREHNTKPNTPSAIALSYALQSDIRDAFREDLVRHVRENTAYIQEILTDTLTVSLERLNTGLQKLFVLARRLPANSLSFTPGEGALYGVLSVTDSVKVQFSQAVADLNLSLTPGAVFLGGPIDISELLATPQTSYRLSLMAAPLVPK